jgi:hypothetical protein
MENMSWKLQPKMMYLYKIASKNRHDKIPYGALTHPGTVISLLTPTQDLVFAQGDQRVTQSGGGFRDLTVTKTAGTGQAGGGYPQELLCALVGIPCNPCVKGVKNSGAPRIK